jgi:nucleoside-diphosphate-sugar epimerase
MKIVITGALGHIGSKVIREMHRIITDVDIVMIDNMLTQRYASLFNLPKNVKYRFVEADVLNADLSKIFEGSDVVLHLAAITNAAGSFANKEEVESVNYNATVNVAQACLKTGASMIHLSSTSVYGTQNDLVDENCSIDELRPQSPYAETKIKEERYLQSLGASDNLRFVIFRFGTICGISPGMRFHTAVNTFCWQAVMGKPLTVWRTALHQKRPYLVLNDAVRAICFVIEKGLFDKNIYNVLTENLTVNDIIQMIKRYVPEVSIEFVDAEIMNQLSYEVLNKHFINQGFSVTGSVIESVKDTCELLAAAAYK